MLGTDYILQSLLADGVDYLFLVPGGLVDPFLPAIGRATGLHPVIAAQEGGAAFMADGYARASGKFGAVLCIGGPGATNTVTALSAAYTDELPVLLLTGEVSNFMQGVGLFQDATAGTYDDSRTLAPVTAESYSVPDVRLLPHSLRRAVRRMFDGARSPAHLSVSHDVQTGDVAAEPEALAAGILASEPLDHRAAANLWRLLGGVDFAPRVAMLVGGGMIADEASAALVEAAERFHIPVATTEHAKGYFPEDHPLSLGVFGYAGTRHATEALLDEGLDLLIVIGATLNLRDSMYWTAQLKPKLGALTVNISPVQVGRWLKRESFVGGHGGAFAKWLAAAREDEAAPLAKGIAARREWLSAVRAKPRTYDAENTTSDRTPIHPARMVAEARKIMPRDTIALVDSGAHRAFAAHYWDSFGPRRFLTASTLGPMGWAIAAGIGAKAARPDAPVLVFTGDGCMRMHGMEVQSAARAGLPVIYLVSNNQALGNVWLRARSQGPTPMRLTEAPDQDWAAFARALGAEGTTVRKAEELAPALTKALEANKTFVIDVKTDKTAGTPIEPFVESKAHWSFHA